MFSAHDNNNTLDKRFTSDPPSPQEVKFGRGDIELYRNKKKVTFATIFNMLAYTKRSGLRQNYCT